MLDACVLAMNFNVGGGGDAQGGPLRCPRSEVTTPPKHRGNFPKFTQVPDADISLRFIGRL